MTVERRTGLQAVFLVLIFAFTGTGMALTCSAPKRKAVPPIVSATHPERRLDFPPVERKKPVVKPDEPEPLLAFTASALLKSPGKASLGKRIIVTGKVKSVGVTDLNAHLFWNVPRGVGRIGLTCDLEADQPQVMCVFPTNSVWELEGAKGVCRIEGEYRGLIPTAGIPLLTDCEVVQ